MTDTITKIQPSDLISDSMSKINHNFEIISNRDDVTESKLNQWAENIENKLADIRNENGIINDALLNNVQRLENKIDNLTDLDGITKEVQNIFNNATIDVENLINDKADEAISSKLGDYVKTSTLNEKLDGYVASTAFDTYRSDSSKSFAQSSRIVANSKFLKLPNGDVDCLVRISGEITEFKSVEDYFKSLSVSEKTEILGDKTFSSDDEALEDPDVIANLIKKCEKTFKTVVTEMGVISQTVGPDNVENTIIATVKGENGKEIAASIFAIANDVGSGITLNADNILINSGKTLNVQSGGKFKITSDNFNIDSIGNVSVKGKIKATSLEIKGSGDSMIDISDETKLSKFVKEHQDTVSGDVKWLKDALNGGTTIDGGLVLSNAILTKDGADNITAGMIGSNTSENDIRFFAGSKYILSPITKQKLICVKDTTKEDNPSQIFVRYPSLDKKSTGQYKDKYVYELWNKDTYDYYDDRNKFQYYSTFEYNGSTYYMWKLVGDNIVILTEERDYTTNNLKYHNNDFSLTPKIVAFLRNDEEYTHNEANLTYIVDISSDSIYVDQFYNAYAWVLDSNSEGVSLYDYHNSSDEHLNTNIVIYTKFENVNINDILGIQISSTENLFYKVIDVSPSQSDAIKQSSFKVYEDGTVYMSKGIVDKGGSIVSSFEGEEFMGSVTMSGGSLVYDVSGNGYGGTAVIGYRTSGDRALISLYPTQDDPGLYIKHNGGGNLSPAVVIDSGYVSIGNDSCIRGFKTPTKSIMSSGKTSIDDYNFHNIITKKSDITLFVEDPPVVGMEYNIYVCVYDVKLDLNGKCALKLVNGVITEYNANTTIILNKNTYYHIVFDGECWFINQ